MATPLRVVLHVFQTIFLLFGLFMFVFLLINFFDAGNITWDAEFELGVGATTSSILLAIAFSPGLWSVAKQFNAPASAHQPNYGPVPPPMGGQAPPPGQVPPPIGTQPPAGRLRPLTTGRIAANKLPNARLNYLIRRSIR
ncbi:hypothetical protein FB566_2417 [Stackebrandtia endophytica]|uniref:Uncharacterized protein n=1 Tax=Stackebrandtia endophytica TaxID=1496996 RepID=A0A543AWA9_9ACTN|nr:hypothetical protein [Stackebrandtia endophytica]TQL76875.1 hypothetical protein FB566_2417 [Stackebrandtia endophytica]